jgi:hypothetical protein
MNGAWKALVLAAAMCAALSASTHAQNAPAAAIPPPGSAVKATLIPKSAAPSPSAALPTHPELDMPDTDTAKRVTAYAGDQAVGGADCRTNCDKAYYMCLTNDDGGQCPTSWNRCLIGCPAHSSNF